MRYQDSKEYSGELLRLVLPLMSEHKAALNPVSYAVWYEYVSGINPELTKVVDALIDEKQLLDDHDVQKVFQRFIADRDEATTEKLQAEFQNLPLILSHKKKIDQKFKDFSSNLAYDLRVYRTFFDSLDQEYKNEPENIKEEVQNTIIQPLASFFAHHKTLEQLNHHLE